MKLGQESIRELDRLANSIMELVSIKPHQSPSLDTIPFGESFTCDDLKGRGFNYKGFVHIILGNNKPAPHQSSMQN